MKKIGLLNSDLSEVISKMDHGDKLVVGDAGLPIPNETRRIDLAIRGGLPGFIETIEAVSWELQVEKVLIAEETKKSALGLTRK